MKKILVACNDPGGTMACLPVIKLLLADRRAETLVYGSKYAGNIFSHENIGYRTLPKHIIRKKDFPLIEKILKREKPDLVFTSTSFGRVIDNAFWHAAAGMGIKTFTLMDYWSNYSKRFRCYFANRKLEVLPSFIGVMNDFGKHEMIREGFPEDKLVVTGHPYLDSLIGAKRRLMNAEKNAFRKNFGIGRKEFLVVFAAEPFKRKDIKRLGYTDIEMLERLIRALEKIATTEKRKITLIIKAHIRETRRDSVFPKSRVIKIVLAKKGKSEDFILNADLVTGISSMFLVESFLMNRPTISVRIGLKAKHKGITEMLSIIPSVFTETELCKCLKKAVLGQAGTAINGKRHFEISLKKGKSAEFVINFLMAM